MALSRKLSGRASGCWCGAESCRHRRDADLQALIDAGKGDVSLVERRGAARHSILWSAGTWLQSRLFSSAHCLVIFCRA